MKTLIAAAGIFALASAFGVSAVSAQGRSGGHGDNSHGSSSFAAVPETSRDGDIRGLDRADVAAGKHGAAGRAKARVHGANKVGFCPPGQAKKSGQGSRFAC